MLKIKSSNKLVFFLLSLLVIVFLTSFFFSKENKSSKQEIKVKLITSVHKDLPFQFKTEEKSVLVVPGEVKTINYTVKNLSKEKINGMATFQVYPNELKDYMTKLNCFCYEEQSLKGGEKEKYSLVLLVDPKVTKNIKEAIIQFIFFKK